MGAASDHQHESAPRWLWGLGLGAGFALVAVLLSTAGTLTGGYLDGLERRSLDARFQLREELRPTEPDPDILVLLIDDWGVEAFEHPELAGVGAGAFPPTPWPWPRALYGIAARYLAAAGAEAVFFDFEFASDSLHQTLGDDDDVVFAHMQTQAGNVYHTLLPSAPIGSGGSGGSEATGDTRALHDAILEAQLAQFPEGRLEAASVPVTEPTWNDYASLGVPVATLASSAKGFGSVLASIDPDGVVREVELVSRFRGATYPAISLVLAAQRLGVDVRPAPGGGGLALGDRAIPIDERGHLTLNWHGPAGAYESRGLHRIIWKALAPDADPAADRDLFAGKIVLVGSSALALADLKATPFGSSYPGVEVHATALDNLLNADFVHRPGRAARWGALVALFLAAGLALTRRQSALVTFGVYAAFAAATFAAVMLAFVFRTWWVDLVLPQVGLVALFASAQTFHYLTEGRQRRELRATFQRYLSPAVVNEVLKLPPDELRLGGDRRELTVYFSDIVGFTSISERLEPEALVGLLNTYLGEMSDIIARHRGTLDKYIGDCVMAFWGAPLPLENGALDACKAALECRARTAALNEGFRRDGLPQIEARIGINTGPMLVGNMGSERHFDFTVMGDAVNLASRLEGANKGYGTAIMIGEGTVEEVGSALEVRELDRLRVKGKELPVAVFELLGLAGEIPEATARLRDTFAGGLSAYRAQDWGGALEAFERCLALDPGDGPAQTYRDRCVAYRERPPSADWDGVYAMRTK